MTNNKWTNQNKEKFLAIIKLTRVFPLIRILAHHMLLVLIPWICKGVLSFVCYWRANTLIEQWKVLFKVACEYIPISQLKGSHEAVKELFFVYKSLKSLLSRTLSDAGSIVCKVSTLLKRVKTLSYIKSVISSRNKSGASQNRFTCMDRVQKKHGLTVS